MLEFMHGDMFEAPADIRVNTVNCVGVMGAGVALAFKQRYPEMFKDYQRDCRNGLVKPGAMHIWKSLSGDWIVNFPTKRDWREPSRYEDIEAGLEDLRRYLNAVGPVTVALPALGCGNGGLDWTRVSSMIREKLDGVDAHVLVFEPAASRQAGRTAVRAPTSDELKASEKLGYRLVEHENLSTFEASTQVYVLGNQELLAHSWIALVPSRAPAKREIRALGAIATELARSGKAATVALVHSTRASEEIAELFVSQGIDTVLLLPFGVLTRKFIPKLPTIGNSGELTLVSSVPANAKWSRQIFAQAMDMLRTNAAAMLLSDPDPVWLTSQGLAKWAQTPTSYIRYETTPSHVREALAGVGAKPIGRRSEDGLPNIEHLSKSSKHGIVSDVANSEELPKQRIESATETFDSSSEVDDRDTLTINLGELSSTIKRELFDALLGIDASQLDVTVKLSNNLSDSDLHRLMETLSVADRTTSSFSRQIEAWQSARSLRKAKGQA